MPTELEKASARMAAQINILDTARRVSIAKEEWLDKWCCLLLGESAREMSAKEISGLFSKHGIRLVRFEGDSAEYLEFHGVKANSNPSLNTAPKFRFDGKDIVCDIPRRKECPQN